LATHSSALNTSHFTTLTNRGRIRRHYIAGMTLNLRKPRGLTLTELLCVIAIIAILAAFYLPALSRAYVRVKEFLGAF
jgi:prepilin-type N-terminal cleavage/methylation domain-containing protein